MTELVYALGLVVLMIGCTMAGIAMGFRRAQQRSRAAENTGDSEAPDR